MNEKNQPTPPRVPRALSTTWRMALGIICLGLWLSPAIAQATIPAQFARTPSLSPDGKRLAFGWRGDLWVASAQGGVARRLTAHKGYDSRPIWSRDGRKIAFASRRHGNFDVFVMSAVGGTPTRLTYNSAHDYPVDWSLDGKQVYFRSKRHRVHTSRAPLYSVSTKGGTPQRILNVDIAGAALSPNGQWLAFTRGSDRWWRKRWKGPHHSHLWLYNTRNKRFERITPAGYSASSPTWLNQHTIVYRSEKSGTFELWKYDTTRKQHTQLTSFGTTITDPSPWAAVRFPRASSNGKSVVFARWDKLYIWDATSQRTREVAPLVSADQRQNATLRKIKRKGISEYKVSPNGKEVAFVIRGNIFVKKLRDPFPWARRIGPSHWRDRQIAWSPDGRKLAFVSDRMGGRNAVYIIEAGSKKGRPLLMSRTFKFKLTRLSPRNLDKTEQHPRWSPSGKTLAFVRGRGQLILYSMKHKKERTLLSGWNLQGYSWSPDGRWMAFVRDDKHSNSDIYLVRTTGKARIFNLSRFPDLDATPVWAANGRVLAFLSRDVHNRNEIRYVYLRKADHERSPSEIEKDCRSWQKRWKKALRRKKKAAANAQKAAHKSWQAKHTKKRPKARPTAPSSRPAAKRPATKKPQVRKRRKGLRVRIDDLARLPFRFRNVPYVPGFQGARQLAISPTGCDFYVSIRGRGVSGLYSIRFDGKKLKRIAKGVIKHIEVMPNRSLFYLAKGGRLFERRNPRSKRPKALRFKAELFIHRRTAYLQKFEEGWNLLNAWFYDPKFHGVDWKKMRTRYRALVAIATNDIDFDETVRMMLGELNASHLGIYSIFRGARDQSADLGIRFDLSYKGKGYKVASVRKRGPAHRRRSRVKVGDVLLSIDGHALTKTTNIDKLLNHKAGRYVAIQVQRGNKTKLLALRPVSPKRARTQRYRTWVDGRRAKVKKWSGGLLSYAHIRSMNMSSLARFERALFAHAHNAQALVIDVRNNGGGWTADMLLTMFFPKPHAFTKWRGSLKGYPAIRRPFYTWHKPSILLCNERSVSNAEIFAHAFKNLKLGTLVGMPTYGGVISTSTIRILDGTWFRIPLRGWWAIPTNANMENGPAVPNVIVPHKPSDELLGKDPQLQKAVRLMLKKIAKKK